MLRDKRGIKHWSVPLYPVGCLHECCLSGIYSKLSKYPPQCVLPMLFISLFPCCVSAGCLPALSPRAAPASSGLYLNQAHWVLKLQALTLLVAGLTKFSPSCFPSLFQLCSFFHMCSPVCSRLLPFSMTIAPSPLQWPPSISLPNFISTLSNFFDVVSSLPVVLEFVLPVFRSISGVFRMIWYYLVVFMRQGEPRVLLLRHHLPMSMHIVNPYILKEDIISNFDVTFQYT